jgi:hypothetical protein
MDNWQPLTNIWDDYSEKLDSIEEADLAEEIVYPNGLFMGEGEKDDVKTFVTERMQEMYEHAQKTGGVNLQWVSGFLFKSLITGMMWERERVGR